MENDNNEVIVLNLHINLFPPGEGITDVDGACFTEVHNGIAFELCVEGCLEVTVGDSLPVRAYAGQCVIVPSDTQVTFRHFVDPVTKRHVKRYCFIIYTLDNGFSFDEMYSLPIMLSPAENASLAAVINEIYLLHTEKNYYLFLSGAYRIADILFRVCGEKLSFSSGVLPAMQYMHKNYNQKVSADDLAEMCGMSRSTFFRSFRSETGKTPIQYLNDIRINTATNYLFNTDLPVSEIANMVGIEDPFYFYRLYKKYNGMGPSLHRYVVSLHLEGKTYETPTVEPGYRKRKKKNNSSDTTKPEVK